MLEVNNLSKNFAGTGRETEFAAVDGISFTLDAGECLGLIGESGCGKSTTARLITGLVQADAGSVLLEGEEILGRKGRRQREVYRKIQMVFQTPQDSFDPMQTLETGILEAFRNQGMSRKEAVCRNCWKKWSLPRKRRNAIPARRAAESAREPQLRGLLLCSRLF